MSASPAYAYCELCSCHVDNCECAVCRECGVSFARLDEPLDSELCLKCRPPQYVVHWQAGNHARWFATFAEALAFYRTKDHRYATLCNVDHDDGDGLTEEQREQVNG